VSVGVDSHSKIREHGGRQAQGTDRQCPCDGVCGRMSRGRVSGGRGPLGGEEKAVEAREVVGRLLCKTRGAGSDRDPLKWFGGNPPPGGGGLSKKSLVVGHQLLKLPLRDWPAGS